MKPRLRKFGGLWSCSSGPPVTGWGLTPRQAYEMWQGRTVPLVVPLWPWEPQPLPFAPLRDDWPLYDGGTACPPVAMPIAVSRLQ